MTPQLRKYRISVTGTGFALSIGKIPLKTWQYIQDTFHGDGEAYLEALGEGDVPDEHQPSPEVDEATPEAFCANDLCDQPFSCADVGFTLTVENEKGEDVFSCTDGSFTLPVEDEDGNKVLSCPDGEASLRTHEEPIDDSIPYLLVGAMPLKGRFLNGELELYQDFDPALLQIHSKRVSFDHGRESFTFIDRIAYCGTDIFCEPGDVEVDEEATPTMRLVEVV